MKVVATQTAAVVVGSPDPEVLFWKTKLGVEDAMCSQCGGWGGHWWHPATYALGHAGNCTRVPRIPLVLGQGNKEVPAVAGMGVPIVMVEIRGCMAPSSAIVEQVVVEGLLALESLP